MATVKVKPWGKGQGEFVVIDEKSFDSKKHELYEAAKKPRTTKTKK